MINLHERMLPTSAGIEPATSWSPVGRRIQLSQRGRPWKHRLWVLIWSTVPGVSNGYPRAYLVLEKKIFKGFYHIWAWQPFWSMDHAHFSNLSFSCPRRLRMKFEQHWPRGFRGKIIWNYQHFFHANVQGPYKCIQKQTWPHRKKVKCQCMTIILATLVDLQFPMIYVKIQP